ncbi:hypothetical protein AVDCRST_MAG84-2974, partial [uncultured Microcoleus sp.]
DDAANPQFPGSFFFLGKRGCFRKDSNSLAQPASNRKSAKTGL